MENKPITRDGREVGVCWTFDDDDDDIQNIFDNIGNAPVEEEVVVFELPADFIMVPTPPGRTGIVKGIGDRDGNAIGCVILDDTLTDSTQDSIVAEFTEKLTQ